MNKKEITKGQLKRALVNKTGCAIQYDGWPCGTCFFAISKKMTNRDWQSVLLFRGDYKREQLTNLPKDINKTIKKIYNIAIK